MSHTVASFFSGVGGMDIGLERAGFRVISHAEIDPYASAVLAERWPGVPNLGDVGSLAGREQPRPVRGSAWHEPDAGVHEQHASRAPSAEGSVEAWTRADLWAGGPPCQGFSVAGQRRGLRDHRSSLAATWLDLVERHRPGAVLLENVPGILSSAHGLDWHALLRALGDAGYWWAYRVLDAQWFGVPQRRRRVFLVALDAGRYPDPDGPAQVLAVGARCERDHAQEREAWASAAGRAGGRAGVAGSLTFGGHGGIQPNGQDAWTNQLVVDRAPHHPGGGRAPDGLAGRLDGGGGVAFVKAQRAHDADDHERWERGVVAPTMDSAGHAPRTATAVVSVIQALDTKQGGVDDNEAQSGSLVLTNADPADDPLLPTGLDSRRYKAIGNGVVAPVAEWIGHRLRAHIEQMQGLEEAA